MQERTTLLRLKALYSRKPQMELKVIKKSTRTLEVRRDDTLWPSDSVDKPAQILEAAQQLVKSQWLHKEVASDGTLVFTKIPPATPRKKKRPSLWLADVEGPTLSEKVDSVIRMQRDHERCITLVTLAEEGECLVPAMQKKLWLKKGLSYTFTIRTWRVVSPKGALLRVTKEIIQAQKLTNKS